MVKCQTAVASITNGTGTGSVATLSRQWNVSYTYIVLWVVTIRILGVEGAGRLSKLMHATTSISLILEAAGAAIIGGTEGTRFPNILVGGRKGKCSPTDCPFSKIFRT